jgi:hypothetical protein
MAGWVTVRYLMAVRRLLDKNAGGEPDLNTLRQFLHDVVAVRRSDLGAARLKLEQDRLERISSLRASSHCPRERGSVGLSSV